MYSCSYQRVAYEGVFMGPTQGPYILQLCMGPSYFLGGLTPPDPPYFAHCSIVPAQSIVWKDSEMTLCIK